MVSFNDIAYAQSCGRTGHHYKDGLAYKFEDDLHESLLQYIEWTPGRTGEIAPVAVFTPVEIDGCEVSRASLHNLSFIEDLELMAGNRILVSKRNMIIPHVEENLDRGGFSMVDTIPHVCPCCGQPTRIHESSGKGENGENRIIKTLYCDNPDCETRRLKKFVHFVSQKAMDIEGLSEATLEKFIGQGFIHSYLDIYRLDRYRAEIVRMDGFGEKSWQRLWDAIQQSRNTTFERYLISMDIPMIGNTASKVLGRVFHYDLDEFRDAVYGGYDFRQLPDFGEILHAPQLKLLREYALRISSWRCFRFVERLLAEYTFSQLQTIFGERFYFHECFVRSEGYYSRREYKTYISRSFLSAEQHRQLYDWVERSVFQTEPEKYEDFVLSALKAPEIQHLYDKKALAAVLRQFLLHSEYNGYEINRLKETFYSKEELEDERRAEAERKKQEKRLEQEKRTIQKREKLQQLYNGSAESLVKFIGGYYHQDEKNEVLNMAFDKLVEWPVGCVRTMEAKGAHAFFELCGELVKSEPRPRHEILNMVLTLIGGEAA